MRTSGSVLRRRASWLGLFGVCALVGHAFWGAGAAPASGARADKGGELALGREIFNREWLPGDGRSHGGDGLGPVYNDSSCVACHNSGGPGGGGPVSKNIDILNASRVNNNVVVMMKGGMAGVAAPAPANAPGAPQAGGSGPPQPQANVEPLFDLHAGFRNGRTVVLHKFGTDPNYASWRRSVLSGGPVMGAQPFAIAQPEMLPQAAVTFANLSTSVTELRLVQVQQGRLDLAVGNPQQGPGSPISNRAQARLQEARSAIQSAIPGGRMQLAAGNFTVSRSQRNPTSLFGIGLIDAIPDSAIVAAAGRRFERFPEIQGRVSRLKDGRIGRLGWKGQTASSEDFVLTACAVEVGLEVPGHEQAISPQAPKYRASGKDLTGAECSALVAYVRSIPRPVERRLRDAHETRAIADGKALFASVGCATCHAPSLGGVEGIYSDLLLHDMGPEMAESGSYNGGSDSDDALNPILAAGEKPGSPSQPQGPKTEPAATRQEWRTPPLWGFRDSGPYLHDGRAQTLEEAVAGHGGQAAASAQRFFELSPKEQLQIEAFLKSLVAPESTGGDDTAG